MAWVVCVARVAESVFVCWDIATPVNKHQDAASIFARAIPESLSHRYKRRWCHYLTVACRHLRVVICLAVSVARDVVLAGGASVDEVC